MIDIINDFYLKTIFGNIHSSDNETPYKFIAISLDFFIHEDTVTKFLN